MKKYSCIAIIGAIVLIALLCNNNADANNKPSPLHVKGTNIVNSAGKKITLKGVSTHGIAWYPEYVNKACIKSFKKMGANTVRLAFYSDPASGYNTDNYKVVERGIEAATELGMYVIVDWHILADGNPNTHYDNAKKFFEYIASKYSKHTNILYEICNEPNGNVTWEKDIKPYAKKIIPVIRQYDSDAIVIVGTPTWSQDVDIVSKNPLNEYDNIVYALHFYAATHSTWNRDKLQVAIDNGLPVIVSEFSICDASGNGRIDKKEAAKWMKMLKKYKIGRIAWSVCNKNETSALIKSTCKKTKSILKKDLSATGRWIIKNW